ncbi:coiled-coil domain-containing protein R3HCC1L isoform X2 [Tetranychus urticae]|uniref:coiled-coil domain-containing protein R3HCC1L isoform X2 n=1 Tax=Tetranychus urticae TaxID=32264 RepID=UPI00077C0400|nr:coiled-coil domain-containing protein R3HCC1L isoform X2 [Tetranychus urticae]
MESNERSTEDSLCDSLNGCINLTKSNEATKTRQKRPDREFYVPPNAHMSKVKTVTDNPCKKSAKVTKINNAQRKSNQSKVKKTQEEIVDTEKEKNHKDSVKKVVKEEKIEQKENQSMVQLESSNESVKCASSNESEPSWDDIYDDDGDCVKPQLVEQFYDPNEHKNETNLKVKDKVDYLKLEVYEPNEDDSKLSHVLEIYDFPSDLRTQDLVTSLSVFNSRDFDIKWVDDTHALAVFSSQIAAREAMSMPYTNIRLRPLNEAIKESRVKAQKCAEHLLPHRQRPQTSAVLARRLVTGALGLRSTISSEQRAAEKKRLQEAREKRRMAMKLTQAVWEGDVG